MTSKAALQKIIQGLIYTEEEIRVSQENVRKNIHWWPRRLSNKEYGESKYQGTMTGNITHLSILTLNVNGLNDPIKMHRVASWIKKRRPSHFVLILSTSHWEKHSLT
jgi:hypothetical protein